jgi:hypothetical protein
MAAPTDIALSFSRFGNQTFSSRRTHIANTALRSNGTTNMHSAFLGLAQEGA